MRGRESLRAIGCGVYVIGTLLAGCSDEPPRSTPPPLDASRSLPDASQAPDAKPTGRWPCPATWVEAARGGCGPAVLLCGPGGGAAEGACDRVDVTQPSRLALADGGTVSGFYRSPDGAIRGAWPERGTPDEVVGVGIERCPDGWARARDGTCDPALRTDCPEGSGALPGGRCTATAERDCLATDYAELGAEAAGARVWHVRAGANVPAADGSRERPFATIGAALTRTGDGDWVRVAPGEYHEAVTVERGAVHVIGVCAARVSLRGDGARPGASVVGASAVLDLRGVTITDATVGLVVSAGTLRARSVAVVASRTGGIFAQGADAHVEMSNCVVRDGRSNPDLPEAAAYGVRVDRGASFRASGTRVARNAWGGISAGLVGTRVDLEGCAVVGMGTEYPNGIGLSASGGASLNATAVLVVGSRYGGVTALDRGTHVELDRCVIRDTVPGGNLHGHGLNFMQGASLRATGLLLANNGQAGVHAAGVGTRVELARSVVRDTQPRRDGMGGMGLLVRDGAALRASEVLVSGNAMMGVLGNDEGTQIELNGCAIRNTRPHPSGFFGQGIQINSGVSLNGRGVLIEGSTEAGLLILDGAQATLSDVIVRGVTPGARGLGVGLYVVGAEADGNRVAIRDVAGAGLAAIPSPRVRNGAQTRVRFDDLFVQGVGPSTIRFGEDGRTTAPEGREVAYGLHATMGATFEAARVVLDEGGIGVFNANGVLRIRRGVISRQTETAAAIDLATPDDATSLDDVLRRDNANDGVVRSKDLPAADGLPPPPGLGGT